MKELTSILYAEDDLDIQIITKMALEEIGHFTLKSCSSGQEAIHAAQEYQADLLLLDIMMPEMDGITTLEKLRTIPSYAKTPVVFITAKAQKDEVERYRSIEGVIDVVIKPFDPMSLAAQLREIWKTYQNSL